MIVYLIKYSEIVDGLNLRIGRVIMYGFFLLMAILLWSSISKTFFSPSLWTLETAQFAMVTCFIPDDEWAQVENEAVKFWDEIASESPVKAKVVEIFKKYNADMQKAGRPYRY